MANANNAPLFDARGRKFLRIIHIISAAGVFGGLLSILAILLMKGSLIQPHPTTFTYDEILLNLHAWAVTYPFAVVVTTSLLFGLFTEWGLVKHYWIISKWILVLALLAVTMMSLGPSLSGMASISDAGFYLPGMVKNYNSFQSQAVYSTLVELAGLLVLFSISVLKPWGKQSKFNLKPKVVLWTLIPTALLGGTMMISNVVMLNNIRNMPVSDVDVSRLGDGTYLGSAEVGHYNYKVEVKIEDGKIAEIDDVNPRKSIYADYAKGVFNKIIRDQKVNVDAVTGATTTSKAYMKAIEKALDDR